MKRVALLALVVLIAFSVAFAGVRFKAQNQSLKMDGDGYAKIADADQVGLNIGSSDFISLFLIKATTELRTIFAKDPSVSNRAYHVSFDHGGKIRADLWISGTGGQGDLLGDFLTTNRYNDNRWHSVVTVFQNATTFKYYVDGLLERETSVPEGDVYDSSYEFRVGKSAWYGSGYEGIGRLALLNLGKDGLSTLASYHDLTVAEACSTLAARFHRRPYASLSELGFGELEMAEGFDTEKVENGDAEAGYPELDAAGHNIIRATAARSGEQVHGGAYAVKLSCNYTGQKTFYYSSPGPGHPDRLGGLSPGKAYEAAVWVYLPSGQSINEIVLRVYDYLNNDSGQEAERWKVSTNTTDSWIELRGVFILREGATGARVEVGASMANLTASEYFYFDDLRVHPVGCVADWFGDPSVQGTYNDATVNGNDLTEQGTGNEFVYEDPKWVRLKGGTGKVRLAP